jgi:lipoate synthase
MTEGRITKSEMQNAESIVTSIEKWALVFVVITAVCLVLR